MNINTNKIRNIYLFGKGENLNIKSLLEEDKAKMYPSLNMEIYIKNIFKSQ